MAIQVMLPNLLWPGRMCAAEQSGAGRGPVNGLLVLVLIIAWLSGPGYTPHWRLELSNFCFDTFERRSSIDCFFFNRRHNSIPTFEGGRQIV